MSYLCSSFKSFSLKESVYFWKIYPKEERQTMENSVTVFLEALLAGDEDTAWDSVCRLSEAGYDSIFLYENIFTKAMSQIGLLWEENKVTVAEEHLATSTCGFVLTRYHHYMRKWRKPKKGKSIMFLCLDQEHHDLGIKMCACLLEESGRIN